MPIRYQHDQSLRRTYVARILYEEARRENDHGYLRELTRRYADASYASLSSADGGTRKDNQHEQHYRRQHDQITDFHVYVIVDIGDYEHYEQTGADPEHLPEQIVRRIRMCRVDGLVIARAEYHGDSEERQCDHKHYHSEIVAAHYPAEPAAEIPGFVDGACPFDFAPALPDGPACRGLLRPCHFLFYFSISFMHCLKCLPLCSKLAYMSQLAHAGDRRTFSPGLASSAALRTHSGMSLQL